jgi:serine/threonine protein kinase
MREVSIFSDAHCAEPRTVEEENLKMKFRSNLKEATVIQTMKTISGSSYTIGTKLGSGTFGIVYKVRRGDGKTFAFKKFPKDSEIDLGALREISILKMFQGNHEGIMGLVDIMMTKTQVGIVMDCYSMDLYQAITDKILTKEHRRQITFQLLKSLAFLKRNGILHRDIKPDNILLDENFSPILADYSLSKVFRGVCKHGSHTGRIATATYRAPEVVAKKPYGFPADAWALGVVLYEMYTQKQLPVNKDKAALRFLIQEIPRFKETPLGHLVKGLLKINPDKRLTPLQALRGPMFFSKYTPPVRWKAKNSCRVSREIKDWCETLDAEKKITAWAAQTYYEKVLDCTPFNAVALACKMYETELQSYEEFDEYPEEERAILKGMDFNLFV